MKKLTRNSRPILLGMLILVMVGTAAGYQIYSAGRPAPIPMKRQVFPGVIYRRMVRYAPHFMVIHTVAIDRRQKGTRLFVTPADNGEGAPLNARTTTEFMREYGVQIAVNGDGFHPWWSRSPVDYYPHSADPVTPNGYVASEGKIYSRDSIEPPGPTMYVNPRGEISFKRIPSKVHYAISGDRMIVLQGEPVPGLDSAEADPRTAVGMNQNGRWFYLVVVDGRQPFYSEGATLAQLAVIMADLGAHYAMNLDGGGSSTLVIAGRDGTPAIINSPIDSYIPGRERPVANHLGFYIGQ